MRMLKAQRRNFMLNVAAFLLLSAVAPAWITVSAQQATPAPTVAAADNEYQVAAVLFQQKAAEYRALCYQAFNLARMYLDADFDKKNLKKLPKAAQKMPRAVVVDIDETVLDNSPAQAKLILERKAFTLSDWYAWGERRSAQAVPGAVDFLTYAHNKGVRVFYVSNRDDVQKQATMDNLVKAGFPDVTPETVLLRQTESSKEARRLSIAAKYRIVILMGDNLDDLSNVFERKSVADRFAAVDNTRAMFGQHFIVLPNPTYGAWESAIYEYQRLTDAEKAERRKAALQGY